MFESLKKTMLASLGAVAFTREKLKEIIEDLVARGELSRDQGIKLFETLAKKGEQESEEISSRIFKETTSLRDLFPVTKLELQKLTERVEKLEARVGMSPVTETPMPDAGGVTPPYEEPGEALPPREE